VSDIEDMDTIRSGVPRLLEMLSEAGTSGGAAAEGSGRPELVVLSASCTPRVTGDDMEGVAEQVEEATGTRVVVPRHEVNPHVSVLLDELDRGLATSSRPRANRVNLVGFPRLPGRSALELLLEHAGIEVNTTLLPEIEPESLRRYREAATQILCGAQPGDARVAAVYERLRALPDMATLAPRAPFGMAASRELLLALHEHLELHTGMTSRLPAVLAHYEAPWARLVEASTPYAIGFVLEDGSLDSLERTRSDTGIPVLSVVAELGFTLELVLAGPEHRRGALRARVEAEVPEARLRFVELPPATSLAEGLRASKAAAFYSELYFDRRLSRAGKSRIGPADFAMGPDGALETGHRLLAAARTSFYRTSSSVLREAGGERGC
jgi:hypothetical protein